MIKEICSWLPPGIGLCQLSIFQIFQIYIYYILESQLTFDHYFSKSRPIFKIN